MPVYEWPLFKLRTNTSYMCIISRAVARSENPGGHVLLGGDNMPPLVEMGLTDLPKSGGPPPLATGLIRVYVYYVVPAGLWSLGCYFNPF